MKKKTHPIVKAFRITGICIFLLIVVSIFVWLAAWSVSNMEPQEAISYEDNVQLNESEQHHRSEGHNIKFVEDIF